PGWPVRGRGRRSWPRARPHGGRLERPELGVLREGVVRVEAREDQAGDTVAKALPQQIHLDEREDRMRNELMRVKRTGGVAHLLGHQAGVAVVLLQKVRNIR